MFYAFDHVVLHYTLQLSLNETVGAAHLLERLRRPLNAHDTWNLNLELSPQRLQQTLETIIAVGGQPAMHTTKQREGRRRADGGQKEGGHRKGAIEWQPSGAQRRQQAGRGDARGGGWQGSGNAAHAPDGAMV